MDKTAATRAFTILHLVAMSRVEKLRTIAIGAGPVWPLNRRLIFNVPLEEVAAFEVLEVGSAVIVGRQRLHKI
jgi:hypothetical protein